MFLNKYFALHDISEVVDKQWNKQKYISHRDISLRTKEGNDVYRRINSVIYQ